jgi:uncharacterized membrane protein AbrB (regulator of aidB expression)
LIGALHEGNGRSCTSTSSWPVVGVRRLRPGAQFVVGSAIGIRFTDAIVRKLVVIGCSPGAQFRREFVTRLMRMALASTASIVMVLAVMASAAIACALPAPPR